MKFGVREICDVVLRAKAKQKLGNRTFYKNEPVLYFDTLKTSTLEGAATTVYATGGRGNSRLVAWEGERTVTFTFEDALISTEGFAILSGAGLVDATTEKPIYVHQTSQVEVGENGEITLEGMAVCWNGGRYDKGTYTIGESVTDQALIKGLKNAEADIFCMKLDDHGNIEVEPCVPATVVIEAKTEGVLPTDAKIYTTTITCEAIGNAQTDADKEKHALKKGDVVLVDYYVLKTGNAKQIEITADKFAGNYYLEASTLFRRESDGVDMPAEFIIPNGKIQSAFTFTMASSGDPSTFTFTMDAFPDYVKFDKTKKVIAAIQIIEDDDDTATEVYRNSCPVATLGE